MFAAIPAVVAEAVMGADLAFAAAVAKFLHTFFTGEALRAKLGTVLTHMVVIAVSPAQMVGAFMAALTEMFKPNTVCAVRVPLFAHIGHTALTSPAVLTENHILMAFSASGAMVFLPAGASLQHTAATAAAVAQIVLTSPLAAVDTFLPTACMDMGGGHNREQPRKYRNQQQYGDYSAFKFHVLSSFV